MVIPNSSTIPNFVKARTPQGVRRLYLRQSSNMGGFLQPVSINFANGEWYIWFVAQIRDDDKLLTGENEDESRKG